MHRSRKSGRSLSQSEALAALEPQLQDLRGTIASEEPETAMETIKAAETAVRAVEGSAGIGSLLAKARRALKGDAPDREEADAKLDEALQLFATEIVWRTRATEELAAGLEAYDQAIRHNIGLRSQERLPDEIAKAVAACRSVHRDISLSF